MKLHMAIMEKWMVDMKRQMADMEEQQGRANADMTAMIAVENNAMQKEPLGGAEKLAENVALVPDTSSP